MAQSHRHGQDDYTIAAPSGREDDVTVKKILNRTNVKKKGEMVINPDSQVDDVMNLMIRQASALNGTSIGGNITIEELCAMLWYDDMRLGLWRRCHIIPTLSNTPSSNIKITISSSRFVRNVRNDEYEGTMSPVPSSTPWWTCHSLIFSTVSNLHRALDVFSNSSVYQISSGDDGSVVGDPSAELFNEISWSMMCATSNIRIFSLLTSWGVDMSSDANVEFINGVWTNMLADKKTIDFEIVKSSMGLKWEESKSTEEVSSIKSDLYEKYQLTLMKLVGVSSDANLGLFKPENDDSKSKEHDILSRFGSWGEYYSKRSS